MMMFWLYTGIVIAAPVEEVHRMMKDIRNKPSEQREQMIRDHEQMLENMKRNQSRSHLEVQSQEKTVQALRVEHTKKELVEFLQGSEFEEIQSKLFELGFDQGVSDLIKNIDENKDVEVHLDDLYLSLPRKLSKNSGIKLTARELEIVGKLLTKVLAVLQEHISNTPVKYFLDHIDICAKPPLEQWSSLWSSFEKVNFKGIEEHLRKNIMLYALLAMNILSIVLVIYANKSHNKSVKDLAYVILATVVSVDVVAGCMAHPNSCRFLVNAAELLQKR
jgi:hypothetical protein